MKKQKKK
jgi:hypothetical protein